MICSMSILSSYFFLKYFLRKIWRGEGESLLKNGTIDGYVNVFWTLIASKRKNEQITFFNWLSNVKNLVFSNGFEHVRNVIQWE